MEQAIVAGCIAVAALNLAPAVVGGAVWYRGRPDGDAAGHYGLFHAPALAPIATM